MCLSTIRYLNIQYLRKGWMQFLLLNDLRLRDIALPHTCKCKWQLHMSVQFTLKRCTLWKVWIRGFLNWKFCLRTPLTSLEKWWRHIHCIFVRSSDTIHWLKEPYCFDLEFENTLSSNKGTMCSIYLDILLGQ